MRQSIQPDPTFGDISYLRREIKRTRDVDLLRRLQGILYRMQDKPPGEVIELLGIGRSTLHEWVRKWNQGGVEVLRTRPRSGRPRGLEVTGIKDMVVEKIEGSLKDGTPYTAIAIHGYLKKKDLE